MATRYIRKYGGVIGGAIGGTIGTLIAPGVGTSIGASLGSGIGSSIDDTIEADKAEKNAIAQERQQHRLISSLQQIEMDNAITPTPTFRDGGNITRYNGNSHENGGIQLGATTEVEGGETRGIDDTKDYIFSDTLKPNGSKKTYAELSKDIDNKYIRKNDRFSMASKNRELQNLSKLNEESRIAEEQLKADKFDKRVSRLQKEFPEQADNLEQFKMGGKIKNRYSKQLGGILEGDPLNPNSRNNYNYDLNPNQNSLLLNDARDLSNQSLIRKKGIDRIPINTVNPNLNASIDNLSDDDLLTLQLQQQGYEGSTPKFTNALNTGIDRVGQGIDNLLNRQFNTSQETTSNPFLTTNGDDIMLNKSEEIIQEETDTVNPGYKAPVGRALASTLPGIISGAANLNIANKVRYSRLTPQVYTPNLQDPRRTVQDVNTAFSSANENIRRNAASTGNYLSNRIGSAVAQGRTLDRVYSGFESRNIDTLNQANQINQAERSRVSGYNAQIQDRERQDKLNLQAQAAQEFSRAASQGIGLLSSDVARFEEAQAASPENFTFTYFRDDKGNRITGRVVKGSNYTTAEDANGNLYLNVNGEYVPVDSTEAKDEIQKIKADRTKAIESATAKLNKD